MEGAVATLQALTNVAPEEPSYKQLLGLARRQLEREGWYRFQSQFYREDVDHHHAAGGRKGQIDNRSLAEAERQAPPASLDELLLLRLKLSTWLSPGMSGPAR